MLGTDFKRYTENEKSSGLCPTQKLSSGLAEPGRVVRETTTYVVGRTAYSATWRVFFFVGGGGSVSVYLFWRFKRWHFYNHFYVAVFKAIFVNVLILVFTVLRWTWGRTVWRTYWATVFAEETEIKNLVLAKSGFNFAVIIKHYTNIHNKI
jgi:hypothetical protein